MMRSMIAIVVFLIAIQLAQGACMPADRLLGHQAACSLLLDIATITSSGVVQLLDAGNMKIMDVPTSTGVLVQP